ncbi:hypothetical protein FTV88_2731 [Heliorestis convoluta]|uniref:Uncharacterized protein n=1 Tax=Heliorestis convoluta TaxID=356322 RepID=A0A5Q2N974_9FIRM|nr:hypothetical protein FTV88_2731 [Heliorestis convoluta]
MEGIPIRKSKKGVLSVMSHAHGFFGGGLRSIAGLVIALIVIGAFFPHLFGRY